MARARAVRLRLLDHYPAKLVWGVIADARQEFTALIPTIPSIGQGVAYLSPLTYGNDLIQAAYHGHTYFNPLLDIAMLCIFILVFQIFANRLYRRWNE